MKILSLELATERAGVAFVDTDCPEGYLEETWEEARARHGELLPALDRLKRRGGWDWRELDLMVAGRGPGAFSGLRAGLLTVGFLAAPGGTPCRFVSSMEAAAKAWLGEQQQAQAMVIGDARRGHLWMGLVEADYGSPPCAWELIPGEQFATRRPTGLPLLSPHLDRILALAGADAIGLNPTPEATARLAWQREKDRAPAEPAIPLYLHPPV